MDGQKKMAIKLFFKGIKVGFHLFGESINKIVNTVLLTVTYFVGVGTAAAIARLQKKKLMDLKTDRTKESYYQGLVLSKKAKKEYYRQF